MQAIYFLAYSMLAGLFFSRGLLSVSMIAFIVLCTVHGSYRKQIRYFFSATLLWSLSLLFVIPLISGIWSTDAHEWVRIMQVKIPFLFLPFAFAGEWTFSDRKWKHLLHFFIFLLIITSVYSFMTYLQQSEMIHQRYLEAGVMDTPGGNDHVRYSWLVATGILFCLLLMESAVGWKEKTSCIIAVAWFLFFLHVLAARTGLAVAYMVLILYFIRLMITGKNCLYWFRCYPIYSFLHSGTGSFTCDLMPAKFFQVATCLEQPMETGSVP
jgi:hypothetical protein